MTGPAPAIALIAGAASFLSPCVLPLVPGYLSLMSGLSVDDVETPTAAKRSSLIFNAVLFSLGFAIVFVAFGAAASGIGSVLIAHRTMLARISGVMIVVMGLLVAGVLRIPIAMMEKRFQVVPSRFGPFAAPVMGMAFAFGWTPCIGPILASVLALAATQETLNSGVFLLALYSLGLAVPFIISATAFGQLRSTWKWFVRKGRVVDVVSGVILVAFGIVLMFGKIGWLVTLINSLTNTAKNLF